MFSSFVVSWLPYAVGKTLLYHKVLQLHNHRAILKVLYSFLLINGIIDPFLFKAFLYSKAINNINRTKEEIILQN